MNQIVEPHHTKTPAPRRGERFALLHGEWHADIVLRAVEAFLGEMARRGVDRDAIDVFAVSGAFELPLMARRLALSGRYDAIVACAFVVDGGVYRHDFVAQSVVDGLMRAQLDADTPVLSVVLTPHHYRDEPPLAGFYADHFVVKGVEAARACCDTTRRLAAI